MTTTTTGTGTGMGTTLHQHQKRPSISNWFSSLRRQPKAKKSIDRSGGSFGSKQQLQRSCFDLSGGTAGTTPLGGGLPGSRSSSTFYITAVAAQAAIPAAGISSDDRHRLLAGSSGSSSSTISTSSSGVCSRCFCNLGVGSSSGLKRSSPKKEAPAGKPPPLQVLHTAPRSPRSPSLSPLTSVATYKVTELHAESPPPASPASPTLSTETVTCSDVSRKVELLRLPCDEPQTQLFNKRCEVTHTTTTTTTRTLQVTRPVELLLNERGEIISKRLPQAPRKTRSNSLGCMLDVVEDDVVQDTGGIDNLGLDAERQQAVSPSSLLSSSSPLTPEAGELRFIDDSSNSPSESERNSISQSNSKSNNNSNTAEHNNNSSKQQNNNCNISNNNNNNNDAQQDTNLCESCRTLIQRNRNNAELSGDAVILRRPQVCEVYHI